MQDLNFELSLSKLCLDLQYQLVTYIANYYYEFYHKLLNLNKNLYFAYLQQLRHYRQILLPKDKEVYPNIVYNLKCNPEIEIDADWVIDILSHHLIYLPDYPNGTLFNSTNGKWYEYDYDLHIWQKINEVSISKYFKQIYGSHADIPYNKVKEIIKILRDKVYNKNIRLDNNSDRFELQNGTLALDNGHIIFKHRCKSDYVSQFSPIEYPNLNRFDPQLRELNSYLMELFQQQRLVNYMVKLLAYCIFPTRRDLGVIFYGQGNNGKSTFIKFIRYIFNIYHAIAKQIVNNSNMIMLLPDKIISTTVRNTTRILFMTHDSINNVYNPDKINFLPIIETNNLLMVDDPNIKLIVIPFNATFTSESNPKADLDIFDKIKHLAPAMLWLMVNKYNFAESDILKVPKIVKDTTEKFRHFEHMTNINLEVS